jgi:hypothetical protein
MVVKTPIFDARKIDIIRRPDHITIMIPYKEQGFFRVDMTDDEAQILGERIFAVLGWRKVIEEPKSNEHADGHSDTV